MSKWIEEEGEREINVRAISESAIYKDFQRAIAYARGRAVWSAPIQGAYILSQTQFDKLVLGGIIDNNGRFIKKYTENISTNIPTANRKSTKGAAHRKHRSRRQ